MHPIIGFLPMLIILGTLGSIWAVLRSVENRDTKRFVERTTRQLRQADKNRLPEPLSDYAIQRTDSAPIVAKVVLDRHPDPGGSPQDDDESRRMFDRWKEVGSIVLRESGFESSYDSAIDHRNYKLGAFETLDEAGCAAAQAHRMSVARRREATSQLAAAAENTPQHERTS